MVGSHRSGVTLPVLIHRYTEAFNKLAGDPEQRAALTPSNAAEAATTMAAVADMQLKLGEDDAAAASLDTSLQLLEQFPCQLPALQVKRTELYLTTLQMQIHIYRNDLAGAQHKLQLCIALTQQGAEYRPGFVRQALHPPAHLAAHLTMLVWLPCAQTTSILALTSYFDLYSCAAWCCCSSCMSHTPAHSVSSTLCNTTTSALGSPTSCHYCMSSCCLVRATGRARPHLSQQSS